MLSLLSVCPSRKARLIVDRAPALHKQRGTTHTFEKRARQSLGGKHGTYDKTAVPLAMSFENIQIQDRKPLSWRGG